MENKNSIAFLRIIPKDVLPICFLTLRESVEFVYMAEHPKWTAEKNIQVQSAVKLFEQFR